MTRFRIRRTTSKLANGTRVTTTKAVVAPELEWRLQAACVRALKAEPGYGDAQAPGVLFTLAGDMNAARRSPQEQVKAAATGIAPGDPDLRLYIAGGRLGLIEYKGEKGRLSDAQKVRHPLLNALGFDVRVVKAATEEEAVSATLAIVREWLLAVPANDNGLVADAATG